MVGEIIYNNNVIDFVKDNAHEVLHHPSNPPKSLLAQKYIFHRRYSVTTIYCAELKLHQKSNLISDYLASVQNINDKEKRRTPSRSFLVRRQKCRFIRLIDKPVEVPAVTQIVHIPTQY